MQKKERSDELLIKSFLDGNSKGFDVLYERYRRQLYSYLNGMFPSQRHIADDIFQQTWIKIIKKLNSYQSKQRFLAWAMRIAHNLAIDHFRKMKRWSNDEISEENIENCTISNGVSPPWKELDKKELKEALNRALKELAPVLNEVFMLRWNGMSFKEIAKIQECSINTATGRMQYALKNLEKLLSKWRNEQ